MKIQYKHIVAIIYTLVLFIDRLDLTIVNMAFPTIAKELTIPLVATEWINLSFLLALAISIPVSSWMGERFGLKRIFILSTLLFGISSTLCIISSNLHVLSILRFTQGIGGGMLIPVGMTMVYHAYKKSEYANITSYTFLPSLMAPAFGPILGGLLLERFGWHSVFIFSGPICLILCLIAIFLLKEDTTRTQKPFDWLGFLLASSCLLDAFYALSTIGKVGFNVMTVSCIALLIPLVILFIMVEKKHTTPLIDLKLFENSTFVTANLIQLCFQSCHFGAIFLVGMFLQIGIGFSAAAAGLIMGSQAFGAMLTSRLSVRLFNQYGSKFPITIGLAGVAVLSPCILWIDQVNKLYYGILLFTTRGIFSGLCGTPIQTMSVIGCDKSQLSSVNSIFNASRQIAISFGIALSSIFISYGLRAAGISSTQTMTQNMALDVFRYGFYSITVLALLGIFFTRWNSKA